MVQGAGEEIVARGFLLPVVGARWTVLVGVILSSLFFGTLHLANTSMNPLAVTNITLSGVFFALYALAEESLWGVLAIHASWNWTQGNIFGMNVSGKVLATSRLTQWSAAGPDWLSGG